MTWFIIQIQFLTRIPVPIKVNFTEKKLAQSIILAPLVGLIIGFLLSGIYYLFSFMNQKAVTVLFVIISEIIITGGLHLDGLADTFDGIFSNRPKNQMLEIMRDSRIGTNGTLALVVIILAKTVLLFSIKEDLIFYSIILMPVLSRLNIVWAAGISTYARKGKGMAKAIVNYCRTREIIISTVISFAICALLFRIELLILLPVSIIFLVILVQYVKKKIGGITGDIIGAVIELSEVFILLSIIIMGNIK